jgi:hypothetical protein
MILKFNYIIAFAGSYRGARTMQILLQTDKGEYVPLNRIRKILHNEKVFVIHQKPIRQIERRKFDVRFYGEVCQSDLAFMFPWENFKYFLLFIDIFSLKLFTEPLKTKSSPEVKTAFEKFFKEFNSQVHVLETDRGSEFIGCRSFFKEKKIVFKTKTGNNKASWAENYIFQTKKRLYMMLRGNLTQNWVKYLPIIVEQHNNSPNEKLGGLTPNSIHSEYDSVLVNQRLKKTKKEIYQEPTYQEQISNKKIYENNTNNIQANDYVYLSTKEDQFSKSYDTKVLRNCDSFLNTRVSFILVHKFKQK